MSAPAGAEPTMEAAWDRLVAVAMLGTDRRDPPAAPALIADVVDDSVRPNASDRMLAQVAAMVAVRRAGVLPRSALAPVAGPPPDDRPICVPAAIDRWRHIVASWPVLEDEWMVALIAGGWRVPPELVPELLDRHRGDRVRRVRAEVACGPLAGWLVGHLPEFAGRAGPPPDAESVAELPDLPIPPDLEPLLHAPGAETARTLVGGLRSGVFVHAHRAVLVNLIARMRPDGLREVAVVLDRVDDASVNSPLASVLADLARTRHGMLDDFHR